MLLTLQLNLVHFKLTLIVNIVMFFNKLENFYNLFIFINITSCVEKV